MKPSLNLPTYSQVKPCVPIPMSRLSSLPPSHLAVTNSKLLSRVSLKTRENAIMDWFTFLKMQAWWFACTFCHLCKSWV